MRSIIGWKSAMFALLSPLIGLSAACHQVSPARPSFDSSSAHAQQTETASPQGVAESSQQALAAPVRVPTYTYEIVNTYPHDSGAFTQGLVYHQGQFYESTGLFGQSSLRRVELETGRVLRKVDIPSQYFGEGLVLFNNRFIQITWQNGVAFQYDFNSFEQIGTFRYPGEGWGITHNGQQLIMSDGSPDIRFLDPNTFQELRRITVKDNSRSIQRLNELEYVKGEIWANIWYADRIARINPATGSVTGWIDLAGLLSTADGQGRADVLNGIAYDAERDRVFVTGKLWPKLFEIRLLDRKNGIGPRGR